MSFKGAEYDVRELPGVMVGEKLEVTYNPYKPGTAVIVDRPQTDLQTILTGLEQTVRDSK